MRGEAPAGASPAELRALMARLLGEDAPAARPGIPPRPDPARAPLSSAQRRLWFLWQLHPRDPSYGVLRLLRLRGPVDAGALGRALDEIVRRHEVLRTTFALEEGEPVQRIAPAAAPVLRVETLAPGEDAQGWERRHTAQVSAPFDLERGPLLRARLLSLDRDRHRLLLAMHHIVTDGVSLARFWEELDALYAAFVRGAPSPLPPPALQYADWAAWESAGPEEERDAQLRFWRQALRGAPRVLEVPADFARPAVPTGAGVQVAVRVDADTAAALRRLARREGVTLYAALLAAYGWLLARWSGQEEVLVASPAANRGRPETEPLLGVFVNLVPQRVDAGGDPSFAALLGRVGEGALAALAHGSFPFERLVDALGVERTLARHPLVQAVFALEHPEVAEHPALEGAVVEEVEREQGTAKFDWTLVLREGGAAIAGTLTARADLFAPATARRLARHLEAVLAAAARDPDLPLSRLAWLPEAERARVLAWGAGAPAAAPADACAHHLFEAWADRAPDAPAARCGALTVRYGELEARANRLAHWLRARGVGPETRVPLLVERGIPMLAALLAVLKAGGAYLPLDPESPPARLAALVAAAGGGVVLAQASLRGRLGAGVPAAVLEEAEAQAAAGPATRPCGGAGPSSLAYVIYTSGSTGEPKGVMVPHAGVVNLTLDQLRVFEVRPGDRLLQFAPLHFDASVSEVYLALAGGATLVIPGPGARLPGAELARLMADERITHARFTPSALALLPPHDFPELRAVAVGGESCPPDLPARWGGGRRFFNVYGTTETTARSTVHPSGPGGGAPPLGRPLAGTRLYVLDDLGRPAGAAIPGELFIGGAGVSRGYLGRPGLTAARFVPDPFAGVAGARMYRTGDRVRWTADGELRFAGRVDAQVKVRGFRVEPAEVEAALRQHPGVLQAAAGGRPDPAGGTRLVAWVAAAEPAPTAAELRAHLRERLPEHMVPSAFVFLAELPRTTGGKTDRRALPDPEAGGSGADGAGRVAPATPLEQALAELWSQALGGAAVGVTDGFFELGGHSLLAARVVARIRSELGCALSVRALFEDPTVRRLAARIAGGVDEREERIPRRADGASAPLSFAQQRVWFVEQLAPGTPAYNIASAHRLRGALDVDALRAAVAEFVRRHQAPRTTLSGGDEPVQRVAPPHPDPLERVDLSAGPPEEREAALRALLDGHAHRPLDLAAGPLFRMVLARLAADEHVLMLVVHHAVWDGWSSGVLHRELGALYAAFAAGRPSPLAEPQVQYGDYAAWEHTRLRGERMERLLEYWRARLDGAPRVLELPVDGDGPGAGDAGGHATMAVEPELAGAVRALAAGQGATMYMALLAAFQLLLARYAGQDDVVVGAPVANSERPELQDAVGLFLNTLVVRGDVSGDPSFRALLSRVRAALAADLAHQELPFQRLVHEMGGERDAAVHPLFQVTFQETPPTSLALPGLRVQPEPVPVRTAKFALTVDVVHQGQGLRVDAYYRTGWFRAGTVERMLRDYRSLLRQACARPDEPVSRLACEVDPAAASLRDAFNADLDG